jgi:site-specific recombinase XerD
LTAYLRFLKRDIKLPKVLKCTKTLPENIDEQQLEKFIDTLSQVLHRDFLKFKALLYFLFYSGIRIGEIDTLKRSHFDMEKKTAKIFVSKTKEERMVVYTEKTKDALKEYFDSEEETENAFNINSNAVQQRFKDFKKYFPDINFHAHTFRHSFAVNCLRKGVDLLTVSRLLGHRNTTTTERYLGLTVTQFQEIYRNKVDKND